MEIDGWKYYNHAAIPTTAPHETPNMLPIENNNIWKMGERIPLLARWTTEFDCNRETNWWYVIKDTPFDINSLKAKRRYEINKGLKNFHVKTIDPANYAEDIYNVQIAAFSAYPKKYRPHVDRQEFLSSIKSWNCYVCIGAFHRESDKLCGYALLLEKSDVYVAFTVLKTDPEYEKCGINAALVAGVLKHFDAFLAGGGYICDGERSINHETSFQDYLEKYFNFRKAYCKVHLLYNPRLRWLIHLIYPIRKLLAKMDKIGIIHSLNSLLKMDEICRNS